MHTKLKIFQDAGGIYLCLHLPESLEDKNVRSNLNMTNHHGGMFSWGQLIYFHNKQKTSAYKITKSSDIEVQKAFFEDIFVANKQSVYERKPRLLAPNRI